MVSKEIKDSDDKTKRYGNREFFSHRDRYYILKSGRIAPIPASPPRKEKTPRPITTIPADTKKSGAYRDFEKETELKERRARTGSVPNENANIMSDPEINDQLARAIACID